MKKLSSFLLLILSTSIYGQALKDSVWMRERSIDRPLTLHRGQFRAEGGYALSAITKRYDEAREPIKLRDEGLSYVRHNWYVDFRYGIFENLTLQVATSYKRQSQRIEEVIMTDASGITRLFEIQKKNGVDDLLIAIHGRAPFTSNALDLMVIGGIYIPIGDDQQGKPEHSLIEEVGYRDITYRYNLAWGSNALVATMGGQLKYRTNSFAFTASVLYDYPLAESTGSTWSHQLVGNEFEYASETYKYHLPGTIHFAVEFERQLAPWFDLSLLASGSTSSGGWDESTGLKVTLPKAELFTFNPGYEILITPKIWLRQRLFFPLAGAASEAPFSINTSLVYNVFAK